MPNSPKAIAGRKEWQLLEDMGIITPVDPAENNEWTSPLHLAPKSDGSLRPVGDFRPLNSKTALDGFPLPNIRHFVSDMKGAKVFSKIDLVKAFHHIPLDEESSRKATITTPWGAWRYLRLPFGLKNSAQSFQRLMAHITRGMKNIFVYLDDVLIFNDNMDEHLKTIDELFNRLNDNGLTLSLKKCVFGKETLDFVGYSVNKNGIKPLPKKLEAIAAFPQPQRQKHLLGFLGGLGYYRRNLPNLDGESPASILQPLYSAATMKLPPGKSFISYWKENNMLYHYNRAKKLLMSATELVHRDTSAPLGLTTDASDKAIGGVLEQRVDNVWQPLGYWNKHLSTDKQKWSVFRRELHAIQQSMRAFLPDFEGRHLIVWTDHKAIVDAFKASSPQPHDSVAYNAILEISQWTSDIRFVEGKSNVVADMLSRPPDVPLGTAYTTSPEIATTSVINNDEMGPPLRFVDINEIAKAQATCPEVTTTLRGLHPRDLVFKPILFDGVSLLCETSRGQPRPLLPLSLRKQVMSLYHDLAHGGQKDSIHKVDHSYYWNSLRSDMALHVTTCGPCQDVKSFKRIHPPTAKIRVPKKRFSSLALDIVGPMTASEGYRYLLTCVDRTTRYVAAFPLVEATSINCAVAFIRGWVARFGVPKNASCDNGNTFISNLWDDLQAALGVKIQFTPLYHPSSLGGIERKHRDLKEGLKTTLRQMGDSEGCKWMNRLPWVLLSRNSAFQPDLGSSPSELVMGENPALPGDLASDSSLQPITNPQLKDLLADLRSNADRPPIQTSSHRQPPVYMPDIVNKATHVRIKRAKPGVLGHSWDGPFPIIERVGETCLKLRVGYTINNTPRYELHHWENCRPCHDINPTTVEKPRRGRPSKKETSTDQVDKPIVYDGPEDDDRADTEPFVADDDDDVLADDVPAYTTTRYGRLSKPPNRY